MNPNNGNTTMDRYPIPFCSMIIISTIIIVAVVTSISIFDKSSKFSALYKNEPDNGGKIPDKYFDIDKRSTNSHSWMKNKVARSPADMLIGFEKSAPMIPYSWQKTIRKKNQKFERNPYS